MVFSRNLLGNICLCSLIMKTFGAQQAGVDFHTVSMWPEWSQADGQCVLLVISQNSFIKVESGSESPKHKKKHPQTNREWGERSRRRSVHAGRLEADRDASLNSSPAPVGVCSPPGSHQLEVGGAAQQKFITTVRQPAVQRGVCKVTNDTLWMRQKLLAMFWIIFTTQY